MSALAKELSQAQLAERLAAFSNAKRTPLEASLGAAAMLLGLWVFDWPAAAVFGFFWLENVLNGVFFFLKMLGLRGSVAGDDLKRALERSQLTAEQREAQLKAAAGCLHYVAPLFFLMHYGMFCLAHVAFVAFYLPGWSSGFFTLGGAMTMLIIVLFGAIELAKFRHNVPSDVPRMVFMFAAYDRVVILHIALVFGGFVSIALGQYAIVYLLIALKFFADISGKLSLTDQILRKLKGAQ
jgi:hypothetical protein